MRVVVRQPFSAYLNMQPEKFTPGQKIKGDTAVYLLTSGAPVDPADDEARELAGLGQEPPHLPPGSAPPGPEAEPAPSGPGMPEPQQTGPGSDLDIDAAVADVIAWVGGDQERAAEAKEAEIAKDSPRSTLLKQLEKITDA